MAGEKGGSSRVGGSLLLGVNRQGEHLGERGERGDLGRV